MHASLCAEAPQRARRRLRVGRNLATTPHREQVSEVSVTERVLKSETSFGEVSDRFRGFGPHDVSHTRSISKPMRSLERSLLRLFDSIERKASGLFS